MAELLQVSHDNGIATLTLNRPDKRNAMNGQMIQEILRTLRMLAEDAKVRVLLINGHGDHFCAGADISWMQQIATGSAQQNKDDAQALADMLYQLHTFPKPTIVLAHGATMGGGLGLLAACDIAIAADNATFSFSEVKIGLVPSTISPYVVAAIGERAARYYFLTGARFDAAAAHQSGLVHIVTENGALLATGASLATSLLQNSPSALVEVKKILRIVAAEKVSPALAQKTAEHLATMRASAEAQEGLKAFVEKRTPTWS